MKQYTQNILDVQ